MSKREFRIEMRSNPSFDPRDFWPTKWEGRESCRYTCRDEALSDAAKIPLPAGHELRVTETGSDADTPVRVIYERKGE